MDNPSGQTEQPTRTDSLIQKILEFRRPSPFTIGMTLAVMVGIASGVGAVAFRFLIGYFHHLFFERLAGGLSWMGAASVIPIPAIGGIFVGLLVYYGAREAKGHGVPEVMLAVARTGGRIRGRVSVVKALASSICIGSGGSVGREGPIVQIGSSAASFMGQRFGVGESWIRVLVACGAAGGISATFNTPIAGVFFALEVILGTFSVQYFGTVVLSSVTADVVSRMFLGDVLAFDVPTYALKSYWELIPYALLGILAAYLAMGFVRLLYFSEDSFDRITSVPEYAKPVIGGLGIGLIGVFAPQVFGVGYEGISQALDGELALAFLAALVVLKLVATSLTLGSGGSGGVFAPSLFIGAMAGTAFGTVIHSVFPGIVGPAGGYGLAGMAAVFAGAAWAPITAILIIFEMTQDYSLILPLMLTVVVSTGMSHFLMRESIYSLKLARRGIDLHRMRRADPADAIRIKDVMAKDYPTVKGDFLVKDLPGVFERLRVHGFPVMDGEGNLEGVITATDVERALLEGSDTAKVQDVASRSLVVSYPDQTLGEMMETLGAQDVGYIPVVDRQQTKRFLGMVRRQDIIRTYAKSKGRRI
jgi:CIC family chloride channel protein